MTKQMPKGFCLFCDMGMKPVNGKHKLTCHDHQTKTVTTVTPRCNKQ